MGNESKRSDRIWRPSTIRDLRRGLFTPARLFSQTIFWAIAVAETFIQTAWCRQSSNRKCRRSGSKRSNRCRATGNPSTCSKNSRVRSRCLNGW